MESIKTTSEFGKIIALRECSKFNVHVKYTLFESSFQINNQYIYSIRLETRSDYGANTTSACDICRDQTEALKLLDILADGMVTSCTLFEILEDIL